MGNNFHRRSIMQDKLLIINMRGFMTARLVAASTFRVRGTPAGNFPSLEE